MASEFGTGKSILILAIVAGCFAILWPNIFYPMLVGNQVPKQEIPGNGCCDVIFDTDVNAIKLMTELCERILSRDADFDRKFIYAFRQGKLTKEIIRTCQKIVLDKCDVDITEFLNEKVRLGRTYKQMLDEIRSLNSSLCLKQTFGISFKQIGLPRTVRIWGINQPKHLRQERPPHLHPEFLHPALREKGRAIPQSHVVPKIKHQDGRPGPIPGIRPPMGGAGHVVPPPKGSGTMGIVMPMYTIGIVVFFMYTMMRIIFKKSDSSSYDGFTPDPDFQRAVFGDRANKGFANGKEPVEETTKLVVTAISGLVEEVNRQIRMDEAKLPQEKKEESEKEKGESESEKKEIDEIQSALDEMIEDEVEDGGKGAVPSQSQLLVSDSHTETLPAEEDHAVVLTGKVTLSLIGLENEEGSGYAVSASDEIKKLDNVEEKAGGENGMENDTNLENNESDSNKTTEIKCDKTNTSAENEEMKEAKDNIVTTDDDGEVEEVEEDLEQDVEEEVEEEEEIGNVDEVENVEEEGEDEEDEEEGEDVDDEEEGEDVDDEKEGEDDKEGGEEEEYEDEIENEEEEEAPYQNENVKSVGSK